MNPYGLIIMLLLSHPVAAFTLCIEEADYTPFLIGSAGATRHGVLPELISRAAAEQHKTLKIVSFPWKRCIDMLSKGQVDALAATIWLPERDSWGAFPKQPGQPQAAPDRSLRLWDVEYPIFVPQQGTLSYNGTDFSGIRNGLSAPPGYVAWLRLKDAGVLYDGVLLPSAGLNLVALNRLDGYVVERNIGQHLLRTLSIEGKVRTLPQVFEKADWYLIFSHQFQAKHGPLTQSIWQSIARLREEQGPALLSSYQQPAP